MSLEANCEKDVSKRNHMEPCYRAFAHPLDHRVVGCRWVVFDTVKELQWLLRPRGDTIIRLLVRIDTPVGLAEFVF